MKSSEIAKVLELLLHFFDFLGGEVAVRRFRSSHQISQHKDDEVRRRVKARIPDEYLDLAVQGARDLDRDLGFLHGVFLKRVRLIERRPNEPSAEEASVNLHENLSLNIGGNTQMTL